MNALLASDGREPGPGWAVVAARLRIPLPILGGLGLLACLVAALAGVRGVWGVPALVAFVVLLVGVALYLRVGTVRAEPVPLRPPVHGRWVAVNSPASRVPSHGVQAYGQAYAVDLVHVPEGEWRPAFGWSGPHSRPPADYPGFGLPVVAPVDGTVVRARDGRRDHQAWTSYAGLIVMMWQGALLELTGRVLGNHVVLRAEHAGRPVYVALAHLQRGSLQVRPGDRLRAGDVVGACGNSGNTSERHVHVQVMDAPRPAFAAGLPFVFTDADGGTSSDAPTMPRNGEYLLA